MYTIFLSTFTQEERSRELLDSILHKVFLYLSLSSNSGLEVADAVWGRDESTVLHRWFNDHRRLE